MSSNNKNEKLFPWTEETIRWYAQACEYKGNDRNDILADCILREMGEKPTLCDLGCGIGYLSLALAKEAQRVVALDANENAIAFLRQKLAQSGIQNIDVRLEDFEEADDPPEPFDGVVMCMFGGMETLLDKAECWSREKIFYITSASQKRTFAARRQHNGHREIKEYQAILDARGYRYKMETVQTKFGQPFEAYDEAVAFLSHYDKSSTAEEINAALNARLIATGEAQYPYYLPADKQYAVFVIEKRMEKGASG